VERRSARTPSGGDYTGRVEDGLPHSGSRPAGPSLRFVAAALIVRAGEVLICQRRPDQPMALQWEFPGGKIEARRKPGTGLSARAERRARHRGYHRRTRDPHPA
jgi:hypothetical protein